MPTILSTYLYTTKQPTQDQNKVKAIELKQGLNKNIDVYTYLIIISQQISDLHTSLSVRID